MSRNGNFDKWIALTVVLAAAMVPLYAGQEQPAGEGPAPPVIVAPDGEPAVPVPVPKVPDVPMDAAVEAAQAVADRAADTAEHVAKGDITVDEGTRDPANTPDSGSSNEFWIAVPFIGALFRRVTDPIVHRIKWLNNDAQGAVHALLMVGLATLAWAILTPHYGGLPQNWLSWFNAAGGATMGGVFASSNTASAVSPSRNGGGTGKE